MVSLIQTLLPPVENEAWIGFLGRAAVRELADSCLLVGGTKVGSFTTFTAGKEAFVPKAIDCVAATVEDAKFEDRETKLSIFDSVFLKFMTLSPQSLEGQ